MTQDLPKASFLVAVPPPIWALLFVLVTWAAGRLLGLPTPFQYPFAGWAVFALGFFISASGRLAFARAGTEIRPASAKNSVLVVTGPFKATRNPMYLGILVATIGVALAIGTLLAFAVPVLFFLFVNFISIPYEEEKMELQFGDDYRAYKARVRRWI